MKIILKCNYLSWTQLFHFFVCLNLLMQQMPVPEICENYWCDCSITSSRSFVAGKNVKFIHGKPVKDTPEKLEYLDF